MPLTEFHRDFPTICDRLLQVRRVDRVAHAYLFVGDDSGFLESFARAWIQVCACVQPQADGRPCGLCDACRRLGSQSYDALYEVRPQSKTRRIVVDAIRDLERSLGLTAGGGKLKVGLLVDADRMMEQAQNAFLKTLEEPYPGTLLILLATSPRHLLPTIRSRCQLISLRRNRRDYATLVDRGLFGLLGRLGPGAGAGTALSVAGELQSLTGSLRALAEEHVGGLDPRWQQLAEEDRTLKKKLEEEQAVRVESEYMRLRQDVTEAVQTWFLQQSLIASGVPEALLPHPELLAAAVEGGVRLGAVAPEDADRSVRLVDELLSDLAANVNERLALEAFCLGVCERRH